MKIKYSEENVSDASISWGSHVDPRPILVDGQEYEYWDHDMRSCHTKIYLKDFPDKSFNSVWFDIPEEVWGEWQEAYDRKPPTDPRLEG